MRTTVGVVLLVFLCAVPGMAQQASVGGHVVDTTEAVVPGATAVLTNRGTSVIAETATNEEGTFLFPSVTPGVYTLAVTLEGFSPARVDEVRVEVGQRHDVRVRLQPGAQSETVTVAGSTVTPLITMRAERSVVVEQAFVTSIPLAVRNPLLLINSAVGVTPAQPTTGNNALSQSSTNTFRINGTKATTSDQQIDGAANLVSYLNQVAAIPQVDAVEEFRVVTAAYPPENGRTSGAVVQFSLRSGTSQYHGSGVEFFRDDRFDANSFDANRAGQGKADLQRHQYGFTMGGPFPVPALRSRTFLFGGYEALRQEQAGSFTGTVPTALERVGDFSQTRDANGNLIVIYDPATTRLDPSAPAGTVRYIRDPFPGNRIPDSRLNPVARRILAEYPLPNQAGQGLSQINNYFSAAPNTLDIDRYDLRIDHAASPAHRLTFHYDHFRNRIGAPDYYGNPYSPNGSPNMIPGISTMLRHGWVVTPSLVWEHHLSFGLSQTNRTSPNFGFDPTDLGFAPTSVAAAPIRVFPVVTASRLSGIGNTNGWYERSQNEVWQYLASASWLRGRHVVKGGVDMRKYPGFLWINEPMRVTATANFTGGPNPQAAAAASGSGAADLLLGAATVSNGIVEREDYNHPYYGVYVQDEFRVTPGLTLTFGLRYNVEPSWTEARNRLAYVDTQSPSPIAPRVPQLGPLVGGLGFAPSSSRPALTDWNNLDPRAGAAWSLDERTVVHGGFGVFHHPGAQYGFERATAGASRITTSLATQPDGVTPLFNLSDSLPGGLLPVVGTSEGLSTLVGQNIVGLERD
ncbi:MAG: TonB-dependent receptor, partial [Vicinamibacterales bacterium]